MKILLYIAIYLLIINVLSFILMKVDKKKAIKKQSRISEITLYTFSLIGGTIGTLLGMQVYRHKTKKNSFIFVIMLIIGVQVAALWRISNMQS